MNHRFLAAALAEFEDAIDYYERQQPGLGHRFSRNVRQAVDRIEREPYRWGSLSQETRYCRVHRFPYLVLYQIVDSEIVIVAVMHERRRPGYWQDRVVD
jgi:plasmid stabilization system protein ParE